MKRASLNYSQRMVLVVGTGVALYFFGAWVMTWGARGPTGWVAYAPLSNTAQLFDEGLYPWVRLVIWLIISAVWVGISLVLLRERNPDNVAQGLEN